MSLQPRISIIVSNRAHSSTLRETLGSLFRQEEKNFECWVIDHGPESELKHEFRSRVTAWEHVAEGKRADAVSAAFRALRGELMMWLSDADTLCPWATRLAAFIFSRAREVQWLTSGTPLQWTQHQYCISDGVADGYTRRGFLAGRNLRTSPYFHFPIWRAGTVWRRELWDKSGAVCYPLQEAGDFELWLRFWQHADLVTWNVPTAGQQVSAPQVEDAAYWTHAARHLEAAGTLRRPGKWEQRIQGQLTRRIPTLRARFGEMAPVLWISPPTLEHGLATRHIL